MKKFVVQRMSKKDYDAMMSGSYFFNVINETVEAESPEEALAKVEAEYPTYKVNPYVCTLEEIEARKEAERKRAEEFQRKEEEKKQKRIEAERRRAEAEGLTVEELRKQKAKKAKISKLNREIAELEKALAYKRAQLEGLGL
jgi:predicted RNase H-like nuclease (RuvC/YqgF family)